jgi:hypothetical protein
MTRVWIVVVALLCSLESSAAPQPVAVRMRHVMLHLGYGAELYIDDLRGRLESRTDQPPTFDDIKSYVVQLDYGKVDVTANSLTNLMNRFVFAKEDAPIKKIAMSVEGQELVQTGVLKKGVSIPFKMHASVSVNSDGRLRIHPTSLKAAGFVSKRVLDFFGLELERLVSTKDTPGVAIDGDDLLLNPEQMLPPPQIRGKLSRAWIENGRLALQFGDPSARGLETPVRAANFMYYRGGVLRFGRLTMNDADLLLLDDDPSDPFDFDPVHYNNQLVAGYSKNTKIGGLIVHMPDAKKIQKGLSSDG